MTFMYKWFKICLFSTILVILPFFQDLTFSQEKIPESITKKALEFSEYYISSQYVGNNIDLYGCAFTSYWKREVTKPNARFQEVCFYFAYMYKFVKNDIDFLNRSLAAIKYWCSLQDRDGLFPEFPMSGKSLSATAFGVIAVGRTLLLLESDVSECERNKIIYHIEKSLKYLLTHDFNEMVIYGTNQKIGVLAALTTGYRLTGKQDYYIRYKELQEWIIKNEIDFFGIGREGVKVNEKWFDYSFVQLYIWYLTFCDVNSIESFVIGRKLSISLSNILKQDNYELIVSRNTKGVHALIAWGGILNDESIENLAKSIFEPGLIQLNFDHNNRYIFSMWLEIFLAYHSCTRNKQPCDNDSIEIDDGQLLLNLSEYFK